VALLSPELLQKLARLRLGSRRRVPSAADGAQRSRRRGQSQEFLDHRPYVPGDDLRFLDWHLYGRLDSLWIKLFEEERDRTVQLLVDCSGSMEGGKLTIARELAAALGFVALGGTDRVSVAAVDDALRAYAPPARGRRAAPRVFEALEAVNPGASTQLDAALARMPRPRGGGVGVLFTDAFYPGEPGEALHAPMERALRRLRGLGLELHLVHLLDPVDVRPALDGDVRLIDRETGEEVDLTIDPDVLDRYEQTVRAWAADLEALCARLGVGYVRLLSTASVEQVLLRDLRRLGLIT